MKRIASLRPATLDDLLAVAEVESRVHVAPWTEEHFRKELEKPYSQFFVMTDDETDSQVHGYIVFWMMMDECHILNVSVDLPYRGQGLAKEMVRMAVNLTLKKGVRKIILEVRKGNLAAVHLYQGLGFTIAQIQKNFYSNGEDAYLMALYLDQGSVLQF